MMIERYRAVGVPDGVHDKDVWNHAHTATLEDYKINENTLLLYTPEAKNAADDEEYREAMGLTKRGRY